jgi:hypothetical protein
VIDDPILNYFVLGLLVFVVIVIFTIHDIPYLISKEREHPHQDAIYAAGWVGLFTLYARWPFLWIWAMAYRPERGRGFGTGKHETRALRDELAELRYHFHHIALLRRILLRMKSWQNFVVHGAAWWRRPGALAGPA